MIGFGTITLENLAVTGLDAMRIGKRHGIQQGAGIGMSRLAIHRLRLAQLDHVAQVHHSNAIADVLNNRKVMRDEQIGQIEFFLQILQQIDDLRLNGDIQRRDRLVSHDQLGIGSQCTGKSDTLTLSARKLVRIAIGLRLAKAPPCPAARRHAHRAPWDSSPAG